MSNIIPIGYADQMYTSYFNIQPSQVKGRANLDVEFQKRYLWNKVYSKFKFTLPKEWRLNWFRYWLFQFGSIGVVYTTQFGWIAYPYSVLSHDLYYNPKRILVTCKFLNDNAEGVVGLNGGVVHITDDFFGLDDLVTYYAEQIAQVDKAININLMNANTSVMYRAKDKKQAQEIKQALKQVSKGDPFVAINEELLDDKGLTTLLNNPKNNLIVNELLDARRTIVNEFLTEIGINNANTDKKERLISDEVKANNEEVKSLVQVMYEHIQKSFDELNAISNLGLKVELVQDDLNSDIIKEDKEVAR